ncbi:hypothetical protein Trco_005310 [Trichoderma cornu-damae]|uniref:Transcription activator GCR1-like domain-containing protein n=1 Tax=Trichoderma cornu-damae TaxID=654480 RepID=A0A9P8TVL6_9HYPO|nr:hypothetical protein Trco_005310 [Trichoderma cornu-damae]
MKQRNSNEPPKVARQASARPSTCSGSSKPTLAATPSARRSVPRPPIPKDLPADPPGQGAHLWGFALRPAAPCFPANSVASIAEDDEDGTKGASLPPSVDLPDGVSMELARIVVNMQEYYAMGVNELTGKLGSVKKELRRVQDENREARKRLDTHVVMLRQATELMHKMSQSRGSPEGAAKLAIAGVGDLPDGSLTNLADDEGGSSTRALRGKCSARRRAQRRAGVQPALPKERGAHSGGGGDGAGLDEEEGPRLRVRLGGDGRDGNGDDDDGEDDDDDDGIKILDGAPRLRALLRRSLGTALNRPRSPPPIANPTADCRSPSPSSPPPAATSASHSPYEDASASASANSPSPPPRCEPSRPRYSAPRHMTTPRYASGPAPRPFRFHRMGRTVLDVWLEYKHGKKGNPAIEALEREYGTGWRTGSLREIKYASNYVGVRQKVVGVVEDMCEREGIGAQEACRKLDERVDGRMHMLISALRKGQDPFRVIPRR